MKKLRDGSLVAKNRDLIKRKRGVKYVRKNKKKQIAKISVFTTSIFVILFSVTYVFITQTLTDTKEVVINAEVLDLVLEEENAITISDTLPMYDQVGMIQEDVFVFRLVNKTVRSMIKSY